VASPPPPSPLQQRSTASKPVRLAAPASAHEPPHHAAIQNDLSFFVFITYTHVSPALAFTRDTARKAVRRRPPVHTSPAPTRTPTHRASPLSRDVPISVGIQLVSEGGSVLDAHAGAVHGAGAGAGGVTVPEDQERRSSTGQDGSPPRISGSPVRSVAPWAIAVATAKACAYAMAYPALR